MYPEVNQSHLLRSVMSYFIILTQHNESNLLLRWTKQNKKIIVHPIPFILRDKYFGIFWWNVKWKHCFLHQFCLTNVVVNAFILAIVNWSHGLPLFKSCQVSVEKQLKRTANWRSCVAGGKKKKHKTLNLATNSRHHSPTVACVINLRTKPGRQKQTKAAARDQMQLRPPLMHLRMKEKDQNKRSVMIQVTCTFCTTLTFLF